MQEIMELQHLQEQMEALSKQLEELQEKQGTISITVNAIKEIQNIKKGTEILAPLADGIFVRTQLNDNSTAIVNIGKGITVEKPLPEVLKMVQGHESKITKSSLEIETKMQDISNNLLEKIAKLEMSEVSEENKE
tara:strand:+ start:1418 stop:1822 length:405 start_codon:yes stop_codon:yes gene_type:complete